MIYFLTICNFLLGSVGFQQNKVVFDLVAMRALFTIRIQNLLSDDKAAVPILDILDELELEQLIVTQCSQSTVIYLTLVPPVDLASKSCNIFVFIQNPITLSVNVFGS